MALVPLGIVCLVLYITDSYMVKMAYHHLCCRVYLCLEYGHS